MDVNRREFLLKGFLTAGFVAIGASFTWILGNVWTAAGRFTSQSWVQVSALDRFTPGTVTPLPEHKIAIIRSSQRVGAVSMECTHLGCLLNVTDQSFFCPCHGSEFGLLGQVFSGPATLPLPWYEVVNQAGGLWVHVGEKLPGPKWLAVGEPVQDKAVRNKT